MIGLSHMAFCITSLLTAAICLFQSSPEGDRSSLKASERSEALVTVDAYLDQLVDEGRIGGAGAVITIDGTPIFTKFVGTQRPGGSGGPIDESSVYRIFSMSKPITNVAAMMCHEEGLFELDDPISQYLPEFEDMSVSVNDKETSETTLRPAESKITIRQLMLHTSGMYYPESASPELANQLNQAISRATDLASLSRNLAELPLVNDPGKRWTYSISPAILGRLVEVTAEKPFAEFLQERIFAPLQMKSTGFIPSDPERLVEITFALPEQAAPTQGGSQRSIGPEILTFAMLGMSKLPALHAGDSGLFSTLSDYERFVRMLLNDGQLDGVRIISPKTAVMMRSPQLPERDGGPPWFGGTMLIGMNIFTPPADGSGPQGLPPGSFLGGGAATTAYLGDPAVGGTAVFMTALLPTDNTMATKFMKLSRAAMKPDKSKRE